MKAIITSLIFSTIVLFSTTNETFAQANSEKEIKKAIQGRLDDIFHRWDDAWSYDTYKSETAFVNKIKESDYSNNSLIVEGTFEVVRKVLFASQTVRVQFTAKIKVSETSVRIVQVCYNDPSAPNSQDCVDPAKWGLE